MKNLKLFQHFLAYFEFLTSKTQNKSGENIKKISLTVSVKNNGHFSPIFSLKNLKYPSSANL
jgi:hypothetical protein